MAITVKVYNKPKVFYPATMTTDELKWIIDYCDRSQRDILRQIEANDADVASGRPGRGDEWEHRTNDARSRYIDASLEFKEYLNGTKKEEQEYNDLFVSVARELLDPELFQRITDATQDRMGA